MIADSPTAPPPKQRLLSALDELSRTGSVMDVGVNALLAKAGVAKASLYDHFRSKDELVVAWLDARQTAWFSWFETHIREHAGGDPDEQIDAAFGFLESWLGRDDFSGCPFLTVQLQLKGTSHPASQQARRYANRLHAFFHERLVSLGADHPERLASALLELYLGAVVVQELGTSDRLARAAREAARTLLDVACDASVLRKDV